MVWFAWNFVNFQVKFTFSACTHLPLFIVKALELIFLFLLSYNIGLFKTQSHPFFQNKPPHRISKYEINTPEEFFLRAKFYNVKWLKCCYILHAELFPGNPSLSESKVSTFSMRTIITLSQTLFYTYLAGFRLTPLTLSLLYIEIFNYQRLFSKILYSCL